MPARLRAACGPLAFVATLSLLVAAAPRFVEAFRGVPADIIVDVVGARALRAGEDPYTPASMARYQLTGFGGIGHPPTTFLWFVPFAGLGVRAATQALGLLVVVVLLLHAVLVAMELRARRPLLLGALAFSAVLCTGWMRDHLTVGQVSELIAFAYALAWYHLRRGEQVAAGLAIGVASTLKLFPGVMALYLLLTGRRRAFAAACAAWAVVAAIVTARFGLRAWPEFFAQQSDIAGRFVGDVRNGSLLGIVTRLFYPSCGGGFRLTPGVAALGTAVSVAALAACAWLTRRAHRAGLPIDLAFALVAIGSYLVNPWIWEHYYVLLLLPIAIAATELARARAAGLGPRATAAGALAIAVSLALMALPIGPRAQLAKRGPTLTGAEHVTLHLHEVAHWLPHVAVAATLAALLLFFARRPGTAAG